MLTVSSIDLGPAPTLAVNGVQNLALSQTLINASATVSLAAVLKEQQALFDKLLPHLPKRQK